MIEGEHLRTLNLFYILILFFCFFLMVPALEGRPHVVNRPVYFPSKSGNYISFHNSLLPLNFSTLYRDSSAFWFFDDYGLQADGGDVVITTYFVSDTLEFTVSASKDVTSTTKIFCANLGEPYEVNGATFWEYDAGIKTVTITVVHASDQIIQILWGQSASGDTQPFTDSAGGILSLFYTWPYNFILGVCVIGVLCVIALIERDGKPYKKT